MTSSILQIACVVILAMIAFANQPIGSTALLAEQLGGEAGKSGQDLTDEAGDEAGAWTPENMGDAEPMPLPADDAQAPKKPEPSGETQDGGCLGPRTPARRGAYPGRGWLEHPASI